MALPTAPALAYVRWGGTEGKIIQTVQKGLNPILFPWPFLPPNGAKDQGRGGGGDGSHRHSTIAVTDAL